jgi:tryptophan synthase alpha chain
VAAEADVDIPKVFMGYYNMVYARGLEKFAQDCTRSGISGMIVPDLPPEEAGPLREACEKHGVDLIFLAAPNTPLERLRMIREQTSGFLYLVARTGVTGARSDVLEDTRTLIARASDGVPKAVGFGISTPQQAAEMIRAWSGRYNRWLGRVDLIAKGEIDRLERLVREMKEAVKAAAEGAAKGKAPIVC